jgi:hypothetical protein
VRIWIGHDLWIGEVEEHARSLARSVRKIETDRSKRYTVECRVPRVLLRPPAGVRLPLRRQAHARARSRDSRGDGG